MADELRQYPPTTRRLRKLQQAGIFPSSQVLTSACILLAALLGVALAGSALLDLLTNLVRKTLSQTHLLIPLQNGDDLPLAPVLVTAGGILLVIWIVAVLAAGLQRGFNGRTPRLLLWDQQVSIGPRPHSVDLAWELIVSAAILGGATLIILGNLDSLVSLPPTEPAQLISWLRPILLSFAWRFALLLVGLGLCDFLYQHAIFAQSAAMTRQELEEEIRETEGPWLARWWQRQRLLRR